MPPHTGAKKRPLSVVAVTAGQDHSRVSLAHETARFSDVQGIDVSGELLEQVAHFLLTDVAGREVVRAALVSEAVLHERGGERGPRFQGVHEAGLPAPELLEGGGDRLR